MNANELRSHFTLGDYNTSISRGISRKLLQRQRKRSASLLTDGMEKATTVRAGMPEFSAARFRDLKESAS